MPKSNAEIFLDYLTDTFGQEETILVEEAADGGPRISMFVYRDLPEEGMITGVTYGLSLRAYPGWTASRPEMMISMESSDIAWLEAALGFTASFAGEKRFRYGDVFSCDGPLASDTQMDAVLIFGQSLLEVENAKIQLDGYSVHLSEFYPIYRSELPLYEELGLQEFWKHPGFGIYKPGRPRIQ
jgi:hypothetical protein